MNKDKEKERFKQKTLEIANNENNISGIHNYCDRWCKRCPLTSRCSVFQMEKEIGWDSRNSDLQNERFWDNLSMIFQATFELIEETAHEMDSDLNNIEPDRKIVRPAKTETLAIEYGTQAIGWLHGNNKFLVQKAQAMAVNSEQHLLSLKDAVEIIQWYSLFIAAKIHRAFFSTQFDEESETNDINGSAKIALIAVGHSLEAFGFLYLQMKEKEDDLLRFMATLSKIRNQVLAAFPQAMEFKRPGFDD